MTVVVASTRQGAMPAFQATVDLANPPPRALLDAVRARLGRAEDRLVLDRLADGSLVAALSARGAATDAVARAAGVGVVVRDFLPGARVAVATGGGWIQGALPAGDVIERVSAVFARAADANGGVALDDTTAGLLDTRFEVESDGRLFVL